MDVIRNEYEGWQTVCRELKELNININEQDKLATAIRAWGEKLAILRSQQCLTTM